MCESVLNASRKLTRSLVPVGSGSIRGEVGLVVGLGTMMRSFRVQDLWGRLMWTCGFRGL